MVIPLVDRAGVQWRLRNAVVRRQHLQLIVIEQILDIELNADPAQCFSFSSGSNGVTGSMNNQKNAPRK